MVQRQAANSVLSARSRRRRILFRLLAVAFPFLLLGLVELYLRSSGQGYDPRFLVPGEAPGTLRDNYRFGWRYFPPALSRSPQGFVVEEEKTPDQWRVVVFGGSAAMGDPAADFGLSRMLQVLLEDRIPDRPVEVVNAAMTAINSHVILDIARDCRSLNADAWVLYLGNNEVHGPFGAGTVFGEQSKSRWLRRFGLASQRYRIGQWAAGLSADRDVPQQWGGMEMFQDHQVTSDDPRLAVVYDQFAANYRDLLRSAPGGTRVVAGTVVTNWRDFAPLKSVHGPIEADVLEQWQQHFVDGCAAQDAGDFEGAQVALAKAERLDDRYAELAFRQAQCFEAKGGMDEARKSYRRARDLDALRFRADTRINTIIREQVEASGGVLVDAARDLPAAEPDGMSGATLLWEHVHLNFHGNYQLARAFASQLMPDGNSAGTWLTEAECARRLGWTPYHERLTILDVRGRLSAPPFTGRWGQPAQLDRLTRRGSELSSQLTRAARDQAVADFEASLASHPREWSLRRQYAVLLDGLGDLPGAIEQFKQIVELLPHHAESHFRLGALYNRTHEWAQAEKALRAALRWRPDFARAANSLAICLSHQGQADAAYAMFAEATTLQPSFAEAYYNWGLVLANQEDHVAAEMRYQHALQADPNYVPAHLKLGSLAAAAQDFTTALPHFQAVAELRASDVEAQLNLAKLYHAMDKRQAARAQYERVLALAPGQPEAQRGLQQLPPATVREAK